MKDGRRPSPPPNANVSVLALGALGVVYGDIGTSPLYAVRECFSPEYGLAVNAPNVLGVISLFCWSLLLVITVKYVSVVLKADHNGEGGILALLALVLNRRVSHRRRQLLVTLGLFGAALLYGDGVITPAISVLSAVEGLRSATASLEPYVVPVTMAILAALFGLQRRGTARIASWFGPLMLTWFAVLATLGLVWIVRAPWVLRALSPAHALRFFGQHGVAGVLILGAVVLCITGGEALYADMGHFGRRPIRVAWYLVVLPALLLNYLGQGAFLLVQGPTAATNPFYGLFPTGLVYPAVALASVATIIASQALISGAFSLTRQAVQLGYLPRVAVVHTSERMEGQIYIPEVNWALAAGCLALVFGFRHSSALAAAYGVAVTGTMAITSLLLFFALRPRWGTAAASVATGLFLAVDLAFLTVNLVKIPQGGWFPVGVASALAVVMSTWRRGRTLLAERVRSSVIPLDSFVENVRNECPHRVQGTAVFLSLNKHVAPLSLVHNLKHNRVLHERVVVLSIVTLRVPRVPDRQRVVVREFGDGFFSVVAHYGFMQTPRIANVFAQCRKASLRLNFRGTSFYVSSEHLLPGRRPRMSRWRVQLFRFLSRNARSPVAFFGLPRHQVVELGMQVEL